MKKRFSIHLNESTDLQNQAFREFIAAKKLGWWCWISNYWLIVDWKGELSARALREELDAIYPKTRKLVMEINGNTVWSGYGPNSSDKDMYAWLRQNWDT